MHKFIRVLAQALNGVAEALVAAGGDVRRQVKAIGVTNQRETTVAWDSTTGKPLHPAIVWLDDRTKEVVARLKESFGSRPGLREKCGLPISTYFSATKVKEAFTTFIRRSGLSKTLCVLTFSKTKVQK